MFEQKKKKKQQPVNIHIFFMGQSKNKQTNKRKPTNMNL